jgi:RND superfamily putative drug exporter
VKEVRHVRDAVVVTMLAGSALGQVTMTQAEYGVGESGQATWTLVSDHITAAFPGGPAPAVVVVKAPDIRSAVAQRQIAALTRYRSGALGQPVHTTVFPSANLAEIDLPLAGPRWPAPADQPALARRSALPRWAASGS